MLIDEVWATLGSANLDQRSFHRNYELNAVIDSRKGADPNTSYTARLFSRGRQQIAMAIAAATANPKPNSPIMVLAIMAAV